MSDPAAPGSGLIGRVLASLPPAYLLLVLINVGFMWFLMWFLEGQINQRDAMAKTLFERCMELALKPAGG